MFFHGLAGLGDQRTRVAVSGDGVAFRAARPLLGPSYFRVFRHDGWWYSLAMPGRLFGLIVMVSLIVGLQVPEEGWAKCPDFVLQLGRPDVFRAHGTPKLSVADMAGQRGLGVDENPVGRE